tara:strand:- start:9794 stop:10981 length:1188 start_codon:yes stop_codon:yes gene_type:complete
VYFQTLDDKTECVGVYTSGKLNFDDIPEGLTRTWKFTGSISDDSIEYAWLYSGGKSLAEVCPEHLREELDTAQKKFRAFIKSFKIGKVDLRNFCFFDLVPHDFLLEFCEIRNKITRHVFENFEKPKNYDHLDAAYKLVHKIKFQNLLINNEDCRHLFVNSINRNNVQKILATSPHVDYNIFGTATGRFTTRPDTFPILTMKKEYRKLIKPTNDWFLSLDYNGAEIRTLLGLSGQEQPSGDIHEWNMDNVIKRSDIYREEAKTLFFSWLYNPESRIISTNYYNREKVLDDWYDGDYINTPFDRKIKIDARRAFNYIIQSTTSDIVIERAIEIDKFLSDKKSFISHIVHDEIVIDLSNEDRELVPEIKEIFEKTKLGNFVCNLGAGQNYLELRGLKL